MRRQFTLVILLLCSFSGIHAQVVTNLFQPKGALSKNYHSVARNYQALQLNTQQLTTLKSQAPETLSLQLPFENSELTLDLEKVSITSDNFSVIEALPNNERRTVSYAGSVFYHGKIRGTTSSFATISLVGDQVMGMIADQQSNIVLGAIEDEQDSRATSEYVLYRETELQVTNPSKCLVDDDGITTPITLGTARATPSPTGREMFVGAPVEIYFECDNSLYLNKGSNTINVINYVLGFFNNTALLYANEDIKMQVSQILVWTTTDPEAITTSTSAALTSFSSRMSSTNYIGDFAHFLSVRNLGGGIAFVNNPCPPKANRAGVSAIDPGYNNFPTYSWTVQVVTHELGHNLGSRHTHNCGWPNGPIDGCGPTFSSAYQEGTCAVGPIPTNRGTIMSYCHLLNGVGISFTNGFGPLPGQRIRDFVTASPCVATCVMIVDIAKQDASCGQPNGQAAVTVTGSTGALTYLWSNGQTGSTLSGVGPGTYHVTVADAAGCQIMKDVVITNAGTTLSFTLTPSGNGGFCTGSNITLQATNNASYTYVWRLGGNPIAGATSSSLTVNAAGTYAVTATSGACTGTQSVVIAVVAPPTATITPSGATTFCGGGNVVLNASIGTSYQYQWYNSGTPIAGATTGTYTATTSGSYTVKVSAGNSCEATSTAVAVTVNPSPTVAIAIAGTVDFCSGTGVQLTTTDGPGYTYQWYNNNNPINGATGVSYFATTAGSYTVTTTLGPCSRTSTPPIVTTVAPSPTVTVAPVTSTIQKNQTQTLTGSGAANYNWSSLPDMISNTTNTGTYRPLSTRVYEVIGTANNGCSDTAYATINVIGCGDVTNIDTTVLSPSSVMVSWTNPPGVDADSIRYRKLGDLTWTYVYAGIDVDSNREFELHNLDANTRYEFEIIPLCSTSTVFVPSSSRRFTTAPLVNGLYMQVYPNPAAHVNTNKITLKIISQTPYTLSADVYDNVGKFVMRISNTQDMPAGESLKVFDISKLANGVYIIAAYVNKKVHTVKMVVGQ